MSMFADIAMKSLLLRLGEMNKNVHGAKEYFTKHSNMCDPTPMDVAEVIHDFYTDKWLDQD
jgi:hypothetical protein